MAAGIVVSPRRHVRPTPCPDLLFAAQDTEMEQSRGGKDGQAAAPKQSRCLQALLWANKVHGYGIPTKTCSIGTRAARRAVLFRTKRVRRSSASFVAHRSVRGQCNHGKIEGLEFDPGPMIKGLFTE